MVLSAEMEVHACDVFLQTTGDSLHQRHVLRSCCGSGSQAVPGHCEQFVVWNVPDAWFCLLPFFMLPHWPRGKGVCVSSDGPGFFFFFFFFSVPQLYLWGSPLSGEIFCVCDCFLSNHVGSHILSSWMVRAGCGFVAGIHPSRT